MKVVLLILTLINTSCVNLQKKLPNIKSNSFVCEIDLNKISDFSYLKDKLNDFNSENSDCIEVLFSYSESIFKKKDIRKQEDYIKAIEFVYTNSNNHASYHVEEMFFYNVFYDNLEFVSGFLYSNKESSLFRCIQMGITTHFSVFQNKDRDERYNALYKKVSDEVLNRNHKDYIISLLNGIDRDLYD